MRIVIALGGNALLRRGQPMTVDNQRENVATACAKIAEVVPGNEVVVAHGNGPQVGLLALQQAAYDAVAPYPLDVLGAETEAMIGYLIEQELGNLLPFEQPLATLLTQIEVDRNDPAFAKPTKPIGPVYDRDVAEKLAAENDWTIAPDGDKWRRVVASPEPKRIFEIRPIRQLLDLLAEELGADLLVIATDVDGVYEGWGTPDQHRIESASAAEIDGSAYAAGSMGPKVSAAARFAARTGKEAVIGSLDQIADIVAGKAAGTRIGA